MHPSSLRLTRETWYDSNNDMCKEAKVTLKTFDIDFSFPLRCSTSPARTETPIPFRRNPPTAYNASPLSSAVGVLLSSKYAFALVLLPNIPIPLTQISSP